MTIWLQQKEQYRITSIPEEERKKGMENLFKQIIDKNFPKLWKELDPGIQEANRIPNYLNPKRSSKSNFIKIVKN